MHLSSIIVAAGLGRRFGGKKQYRALKGKPLLFWPLELFKKLSDQVILVLPAGDIEPFKARWAGKLKGITLTAGGEKRTDSVSNALSLLSSKNGLVAVHDGARPLVNRETVLRCVREARKHGAAICAVPSTDTVKISGKNGFTRKTVDRNTVWLVQTPQIFKKSILQKAYAKRGRLSATDDSGLVEKAGFKVKLVMGDYTNIKITGKKDLIIAEKLLCDRIK